MEIRLTSVQRQLELGLGLSFAKSFSVYRVHDTPNDHDFNAKIGFEKYACDKGTMSTDLTIKCLKHLAYIRLYLIFHSEL